VPMTAAAQHLPPRPKPVPNAPGMFAFADRDHVTDVVTAAGWAPPRFEKLDMDLDIAAGRGLEEAVVPPSPLFTRRLRPMRTVRECDCPARCG